MYLEVKVEVKKRPVIFERLHCIKPTYLMYYGRGHIRYVLIWILRYLINNDCHSLIVMYK
jgi:hypothetical protein